MGEAAANTRCCHCHEEPVAYSNGYGVLCQRRASRRSMAAFKKREPIAHLITQARARAKKRGLPCTITTQDLEVPERCPALGILLNQGDLQSAYSLDRVRPELGYVPGNVRVISFRANSIKQDATPEEIESVAAYARSASLFG